MAYASILAKLSELENKIRAMNENSSLSSTPYSTPDVSDLFNRLTSLETAQLQTQQNSQTVLQRIVELETSHGQTQQNSQTILQRIAELESSQGQTQQSSQAVLERVAIFEPRLDVLESSITAINNKIINLETVFLDKLTRIESVVIADLSTRVEALESKVSEQLNQ